MPRRSARSAPPWAKRWRLIRQDPDGIREIEKKYIGFNNPKWPTFSTRIVAEDIAFYHAIGRQIGTLKQDMDPAGLIQ